MWSSGAETEPWSPSAQTPRASCVKVQDMSEQISIILMPFVLWPPLFVGCLRAKQCGVLQPVSRLHSDDGMSFKELLTHPICISFAADTALQSPQSEREREPRRVERYLCNTRATIVRRLTSVKRPLQYFRPLWNCLLPRVSARREKNKRK